MSITSKFARTAVSGFAAFALSMILIGCGGGSAAPSGSGDSGTAEPAAQEQEQEQEAEPEPGIDISGEWDYAIEVSTESVYGTIVSNETALEFEFDGSNVTITATSDGFSDDSGTYTVSGDTVTMELGGGTVTGTLVDEETMELPGDVFGVDDTMTLIKY